MDNVKYTNHLNVVIAIIGVIVIVQTLTRTFWNSSAEKEYSVEVPVVQPKIEGQAARPAPGQRRSAVQGPRLPGTVAAPSSAQPTGSDILAGRSGQAAQPSPSPGVVGVPSGAATSAPNTITIPSRPTTTPPSDADIQGDVRGRSLRGSPFTPSRSIYGRQRDAARQQLNLPPQGVNDAAKRRPDDNAPAPPVRSSMPEQRVQ
jgi:hypothetical protein